VAALANSRQSKHRQQLLIDIDFRAPTPTKTKNSVEAMAISEKLFSQSKDVQEPFFTTSLKYMANILVFFRCWDIFKHSVTSIAIL